MDLFWRYGLRNIFLGIKLFCVFQDRKLNLSVSVWNWISWNLTNFQFIQLIQTIGTSIFSIGSLIELKFSEFSQNSVLFWWNENIFCLIFSVWKIAEPSRTEVLERMVVALDRWDINTKRNINYRSFEPILRLVKVVHTPQCQHWAAWALANLTRTDGMI